MAYSINRNIKRPPLPSEKEIEKITNYFSDPKCKDINELLMPNASGSDKAKHEICQSISRYKRINKLTPGKLAKKLNINQEKVEDILYARIANFELENLVYLTEKLEIKITEPSKNFSSTTPPSFYASRFTVISDNTRYGQ